MEDTEMKNKTHLNNVDVIKIQPVTDESKLPLAKIISMIVNLGKNDSVKKAKLIDQSKAVKKLLEKKEYNASDKTNLRQIFYDNFTEDDFEKEEAMTTTTYENFLKDPSNKFKKKNTLMKEAREFALMAIIEEKKALLKTYLNADNTIKSKISKAYAEVVELSSKKSKKAKSDDPLKDQIELILMNEDKENPFIPSESFNAIMDPDGNLEKDLKNKEVLVDYLKAKNKDKFKIADNCVDEVNRKLRDLNDKMKIAEGKMSRVEKEKKVEGVSDNNVNGWKALDWKNVDIKFHLINFMNHCVNSINNGKVLNPSCLLELANIIICILNRVENLEALSGSAIKAIISTATLRVQESRLGNIGKKVINEKLRLQTFLNANNKEYFSPDAWEKLSDWEKINHRFAFKDYSLNPNWKQWKNINEEQKKKMIELKIQYLDKRLVEINEMFETNKLLALRMYDNIKYYYDKDSKGNLIDLDSNWTAGIKMNEETAKIKKKLDEELVKASKEGSIINRVYFEGVKINTEGKDAKYYMKKYRAKVLALVKKKKDSRKNSNTKKDNGQNRNSNRGSRNNVNNRRNNTRKNNNRKNNSNRNFNNNKNRNNNRRRKSNGGNNFKQRSGRSNPNSNQNSWDHVNSNNNSNLNDNKVSNNNNVINDYKNF